jgi:hypothetical protein
MGDEAMNESDSVALERAATADSIELEPRDARALTEAMTVLDEGGDVYTVVSESGSTYRVDAREGRCTCPDARHNLSDDESCKHERRVAYATGERAVPAWVDPTAVDTLLGEHVEGPVHVAADGGVTAESTSEATSEAHDGYRPDNCECVPALAKGGLPCWPCFRDGFETPASVSGGEARE